jgi:hypothetical protein
MDRLMDPLLPVAMTGTSFDNGRFVHRQLLFEVIPEFFLGFPPI